MTDIFMKGKQNKDIFSRLEYLFCVVLLVFLPFYHSLLLFLLCSSHM